MLQQKRNRSRQKKKSRGKKEIGHGKREISSVKENILSVKRKNRRQEIIAHGTAIGNSHGSFHPNNAEDNAKYPLCWRVSRVQIKEKEQAKANRKPMLQKVRIKFQSKFFEESIY